MKRYNLGELIGMGTFSQIFIASDQYSNAPVAIKVMRQGCQALGRRECIFLAHFSSKTLRGSKHFMSLLGVFEFDGHLCLCLELFDATLLNFMNMPKSSQLGALSGDTEGRNNVYPPKHSTGGGG